MKNILIQQYKNNLEQFVNLSCDLTIKGNLLPAINTVDVYFDGEPINIHQLFKIVGERQLNTKIRDNIQLNELTVIKTTCKINFRDEDGWKKNELFREYGKYKTKFLRGNKPKPIILTHPNVLTKYTKKNAGEYLYQIDGMHRVMSALEANVYELDVYVIINREDIPTFLLKEDIQKITELANKCTWFPKYQEIKEVGLKGQRKQIPRYSKIYDFSILKNKTVVDFGANIGQASIEAFFNGAKKIYNFEYQAEAVEVAKKISSTLGLGIINNTIDFNNNDFINKTESIVSEWDWTIYQAIYRTKEIKDVKKSFSYIVKKTNTGLFFEGNADLNIDTPQFYNSVFKPFNFNNITHLGHDQLRPAYKILK